MNTNTAINLEQYGSLVFSGRRNGARARDHYHMAERDDDYETYLIIVPSETKVLGSSFLLGMFADSIQKMGGRENFLEKYRFRNLPSRFQKNLDDAIERALRNKIQIVS